MNKILALHIYKDIEKTWGEQINIHYEGKSIVGLDIGDEPDAIYYIDKLIKRLEVYNEKLKDFYGLNNKKSKPSNYPPISIKLSYVYLMKNVRNGYYKIGRSNNPEYREKTLQSEVPEIELIFQSPLTIIANEKRLHSLFSDKRIRGEWFSLNEKDILTIKNYNYGD